MSNAPQTPYQQIGGDEMVRKITERFYARVSTDPEYKLLLDLHGGALGETPEHLYLFLSQWLGGPTLFNERRGPPMMRRRHMHIAIDTKAADVWLACMRATLDELLPNHPLYEQLMGAFSQLAYHLRNR